jgi:hypothetical protein
MINCHFIVIEDESEALLEQIMASQTNLYSNLKRPDPMTIGHSLFPQDDLDMSRSMSIDQSVIDQFTKGDPNGGFSPVLVGSVSYRSPVDQVIHHTGFIYDLLKPKPDEPRFSLLFGSHDHIVPKGDMKLIRAFGSGFAD